MRKIKLFFKRLLADIIPPAPPKKEECEKRTKQNIKDINYKIMMRGGH